MHLPAGRSGDSIGVPANYSGVEDNLINYLESAVTPGCPTKNGSGLLNRPWAILPMLKVRYFWTMSTFTLRDAETVKVREAVPPPSVLSMTWMFSGPSR